MTSAAFDIPKFTIIGDSSILCEKPALIVNSRQSKTPVGNDPWVKKTLQASQWAIQNGYALIASIGMNTWELVLWAIGEYGGRGIVICPPCPVSKMHDEMARVAVDFNLEVNKCAWVFIESGGNCIKGKNWWEERDSLALFLAGKIIPISVRQGGKWEACINGNSPDTVIIDDFQVDYSKTRAANISLKNFRKECNSFASWEYVTHWTKRRYGPFPGETSAEYYRDIAASGSNYPRLAIDALKRILREEKLRGSGKNIRAGAKAVSFTSLKPDEAVRLMRWRKRYVMPTFEPYGIAIEKKAAERLGILPVIYVAGNSKKNGLNNAFVQGLGIVDWSEEHEWRGLGDVDLSGLTDDEAAVLVAEYSDLEEVKRAARFKKILPVFR